MRIVEPAKLPAIGGETDQGFKSGFRILADLSQRKTAGEQE
jgi:hypothetical protein